MIGATLKELRLKKNKTQQDVANYLGITRAAYSHFENSRNEPDISTLKKLAEYFEVSSDYLLGIEGMFNNEEFDDSDLVAAHTDDEIAETDEEIEKQLEAFKKYLYEEKAKKNKK
jgi:transcriptional regulator with XRE-family HTH domain